MREESLLCQVKRRWVATTDSGHGLTVYPNLLKWASIERLDQVWVADITYIRLPSGFCYLAAVLDAFLYWGDPEQARGGVRGSRGAQGRGRR